jgi:hypothetical protein
MVWFRGQDPLPNHLPRKRPPRRFQHHLPNPLWERSAHGTYHPSKDSNDDLGIGHVIRCLNRRTLDNPMG